MNSSHYESKWLCHLKVSVYSLKYSEPTRWAKTWHIPHFMKIEIRPEISTPMFNCAAMKKWKWSFAWFPSYEAKRNADAECNFLRKHNVFTLVGHSELIACLNQHDHMNVGSVGPTGNILFSPTGCINSYKRGSQFGSETVPQYKTLASFLGLAHVCRWQYEIHAFVACSTKFANFVLQRQMRARPGNEANKTVL